MKIELSIDGELAMTTNDLALAQDRARQLAARNLEVEPVILVDSQAEPLATFLARK